MESKKEEKGIKDCEPGGEPQDIPNLNDHRAKINRVTNVAIPTSNHQLFRRVEMSGRAPPAADDVNRALDNNDDAEDPKWDGEKMKIA